MVNIVAIIPARSGSKTVSDKNIKNLEKYPLLAYSIAAAKLSNRIERIILSTDSSHYASIAKKFGAEIPFLRPTKYSKDESIDREFLIHAMQWMLKEEGELPEIWVHLRPTTPLREPKIIDEAIDLFLKNSDSTSLRSAHIAPESPLKWFIKEDKYFKGFIDGEKSNLPKEMFEQSYVPNGYIDIVRSSTVMNNINIHGKKILGFVSPHAIEVDSIEEFEYISYLLKKNGSILKNYLDRI